MSFCYQCGAQLRTVIPNGDDKPRECCPVCHWVHYENPKVQVGLVATWQGRMLWLKRANDPRKGYWAIPAGYMELNESLREATAREAYEETGLSVKPEDLILYSLGTLSYINEVHVLFRVEVSSPTIRAGEEALEVGWFSEDELPWDQLAFPDVAESARDFFREAKVGQFGIHYGEWTRTQTPLRNVVEILSEDSKE